MTRHEIRRLGGSISKVLSPASLEELLCCGSIAGPDWAPWTTLNFITKPATTLLKIEAAGF